MWSYLRLSIIFDSFVGLSDFLSFAFINDVILVEMHFDLIHLRYLEAKQLIPVMFDHC